MALTATVYSFEIELAHVDRGVYETLSFRVAMHPSESPDYLVTRVLAYCLEYEPGILFSPGGLSDPDEPPLSIRDDTGALRAWIDIGVPEAARLHRASKSVPRVVVYTHKDPDRLVRQLDGAKIHRAEALELYALDRDFVAAWADMLARRMTLSLMVNDGSVYLTIGHSTLSGTVTRLTVSAG